MLAVHLTGWRKSKYGIEIKSVALIELKHTGLFSCEIPCKCRCRFIDDSRPSQSGLSISAFPSSKPPGSPPTLEVPATAHQI